MSGKNIDEVRAQLLSTEGRAGNAYWEGIKLITSNKVDFPGREHRGTSDPNQCLSQLWVRHPVSTV
ncbi:MAG: CRISPR-associated endonuclease Cas1 [bacterium]